MTDQLFPITPPRELVRQWLTEGHHQDYCSQTEHAITQAARWGADQELLACGKYLEKCASWEEEDVTEMYNYRRPKPRSLRELALESVKRFEESGEFFSDQMRELEFIRKALEQLDD